jgi:hypothetical protein
MHPVKIPLAVIICRGIFSYEPALDNLGNQGDCPRTNTLPNYQNKLLYTPQYCSDKVQIGIRIEKLS